MPTAERILAWATAAANDWRWLAVGWHIGLAALSMVFLSGRYPSHRLLGVLLALPIVSVGLVAWISGNPFNGLTFTVLAALLLWTAIDLPQTSVARASPGRVMAGALLVAFGWTYPHFLHTETWIAYAYASPFGILPCPTLSVVLGVTVMFGGLRSRGWMVPLAAAGLAYGLIGVFGLQVVLDVWLLAGAMLLGVMAAADVLERCPS